MMVLTWHSQGRHKLVEVQNEPIFALGDHCTQETKQRRSVLASASKKACATKMKDAPLTNFWQLECYSVVDVMPILIQIKELAPTVNLFAVDASVKRLVEQSDVHACAQHTVLRV